MTVARNIVVAVLMASSLGWASDTLPARRYAITSEIGMPHLEENLRYATTHEERCLTVSSLPSAFSLLRHAALAGCALQEDGRDGDTVAYRLVCAGGTETTGRATWVLGAHQLTGTLIVRLGGKNMTVYQRMTAKPRGQCD
jgi:hypothetical protein